MKSRKTWSSRTCPSGLPNKDFRHKAVGPIWAHTRTRYGRGFPLPALPFHPVTGFQALGFTKHGHAIWPVMGGSEEPQPEPEIPEGEPDRGFPDRTPVAEMTIEQRAAYYQHHNRQADNKLKAFNGVTPQDVAAMQTRIQELENEKLSESQRAAQEAANQAAADARSAAEAEWKPKLLTAQLKSAAGTVIKDSEQLTAFMSITDPSKFTGEDGQIDEERVRGYLEPIYGSKFQERQWGQNGSRPPGKSASDEGLAEAKRRGFIKD